MTIEDAIEYGNTCMQIADKMNDQHKRSFFQLAVNALDKDIPKAPKKSDKPRYGMGYEYYDWYCPACSKFLAYECDISRQDIYRCRCGQLLDWEGVEDA